jgi:uncharacterized protein (TIGR03435 family)
MTIDHLRILACVMTLGTASAQAPAFDAASIRVSKDVSNESSVMQDRSGNLAGHNATLKNLIRMAYGVRDYQILGGPAWMDSERYEVVAKPRSRTVSGAEFQQMVQGFLAERFGLKLRRETRDLPAFALTVGKNGAHLTEWADGVGPSCGYNAGRLTCTKVTLAILGEALARRLGRSVVDRTGLTGTYNLQLVWTPDETQVPGPSEMGQVQGMGSGGPSLFSAIQEQLGLKLETTKAPVEVLVIEGAEKPSEN